MIDFYYSPSPSSLKVALFLEESAIPYRPILIDVRRGAQHTPAYRAINPNGKTPAIVEGGRTVFDGNAILLYLAEKTGRFLPPDPADRGELLSWLMFIATGLGPYNGQAVHFRHFAIGQQAYAVNRYTYESRRHFTILDERLADRPFLVAGAYTIVDMAAWALSIPLERALGDGAWAEFPHLSRWYAEIAARPAAARGMDLRRNYQTPFDEEARRHVFPQNVAFAAG